MSPRVRNVLEELLGEVDRGSGRPDVHERRGGGNGDRLLDAADLQRGIHGQRRVEHYPEVVAHDSAESRKREGDRVVAGRQGREHVAPLAPRHHHAVPDQGRARGCHGDAWKHRAGGVGHRAHEAAAQLLRAGPDRREKHRQPDERDAAHSVTAGSTHESVAPVSINARPIGPLEDFKAGRYSGPFDTAEQATASLKKTCRGASSKQYELQVDVAP